MTTRLTEALSAALDNEITHTRRLGGGDFAESHLVALGDGTPIFAKTHRDPPANFFTTEATGLEWLRATGTVPTPEVLAVGVPGAPMDRAGESSSRHRCGVWRSARRVAQDHS